jgi:hypothetical protein
MKSFKDLSSIHLFFAVVAIVVSTATSLSMQTRAQPSLSSHPLAQNTPPSTNPPTPLSPSTSPSSPVPQPSGAVSSPSTSTPSPSPADGSSGATESPVQITDVTVSLEEGVLKVTLQLADSQTIEVDSDDINPMSHGSLIIVRNTQLNLQSGSKKSFTWSPSGDAAAQYEGLTVSVENVLDPDMPRIQIRVLGSRVMSFETPSPRSETTELAFDIPVTIALPSAEMESVRTALRGTWMASSQNATLKGFEFLPCESPTEPKCPLRTIYRTSTGESIRYGSYIVRPPRGDTNRIDLIVTESFTVKTLFKIDEIDGKKSLRIALTGLQGDTPPDEITAENERVFTLVTQSSTTR